MNAPSRLFPRKRAASAFNSDPGQLNSTLSDAKYDTPLILFIEKQTEKDSLIKLPTTDSTPRFVSPETLASKPRLKTLRSIEVGGQNVVNTSKISILQ